MGPTELHTIRNIYIQVWEGERPETVRAIAAQWRTFGEQLRDTVASGLTGISESLVDWESKGAQEAFTERAELSAENIAETGRVAIDIAGALESLASVMDEFREDMKDLWDEYQASRSAFYDADFDNNYDMIEARNDIVRALSEESGVFYPAELSYQSSFEAQWDHRARGLRDRYFDEYFEPYKNLNPWPAADTPYYSQTSRFPSWLPLEYVVHNAALFGPDLAFGPGGGGTPPVAPTPPPQSGQTPPAFSNPSTQPPPAPAPPPLANLAPTPQGPSQSLTNQNGPVAPPGADSVAQPPGGGDVPPPPQVQQPTPFLPPGVIGPPSGSQGNPPAPPPSGSNVVNPPGDPESAPPGMQTGTPPGMFPPGTVLPPGWANTLDSSTVPPGTGAPPGFGGPPGSGLRPPAPGAGAPPGARMPPGGPAAGTPQQRRGQDSRRRPGSGAGENPPGVNAVGGPPGERLNGPPGGGPGTGMPPGRGGPPAGSRPEQRRDSHQGGDGVPPGFNDSEAFLPPGGFGPPVLGDQNRQQRRPRPGGFGEAVRDPRTSARPGFGGGTSPVLSNPHVTGPRPTRTQQREMDREARRERVRRLRERLKSGLSRDLPESTAPVLDGRDTTRPTERPVGIPAALQGLTTPLAAGVSRPQQPADRSARKLVTEQPAGGAQPQAPAPADQEAWEVSNPGGPVVSGDRKPTRKRKPTPGPLPPA